MSGIRSEVTSGSSRRGREGEPMGAICDCDLGNDLTGELPPMAPKPECDDEKRERDST